MLEPGQTAPDFSLPDQDGQVHTLSSYQGQVVLLYFYPKDDTPGCTKEACAISDSYKQFEDNGVKVIGVSADTCESHKNFANKYHLPFTLLADTNFEAIKAYQAYQPDNNGILRISYLISPAGVIIRSYADVEPATHAKQILDDLDG